MSLYIFQSAFVYCGIIHYIRKKEHIARIENSESGGHISVNHTLNRIR